MKHYKLFWLTIAATILAAVGCDDASNTEGIDIAVPVCQVADTYKCDGNILSKCVSGKWEFRQTCEEPTQCNAETGTCSRNGGESQCTDNTWKCDENILYQCKAEKWELLQSCVDLKCDAEKGMCLPNGDVPECTNDTWKCDGNTLFQCVAEKWEIRQICNEPFKCNDETRTCETNCPEGNHFYADTCEPDDLAHCGSHTNDCTKISGWKSGHCNKKECAVDACEIGYHKGSGSDLEIPGCEEDTHDACGAIEHSCEPYEICTQGQCQSTCDQMICNGSCINPKTSKQYCGAVGSCTEFKSCSKYEDCIDGKCILTSCQNENETLCTVNEQPQCIDIHGNNSNHCGACGAVCSDLKNAKTNGCDHGHCTYTCDKGMVNCGSDTEPVCLTKEQLKSDASHCGKCGTKCNDNEYCQDSQCIVSFCSGNECIFENTCNNQNDHCGTHCENCNTANHASAGICQNGTCKITSCAAGYHLTDKGTCEIDTATACPNGKATGSANCNTLEYTQAGNCINGICQATECQANAHLKDGKCIADSPTNCGSSETNCTKLAGWNNGNCENGICTPTTCKSGFCIDALQNACTDKQSNTSCGLDGGACQICTTGQACNNGTCETLKIGDKFFLGYYEQDDKIANGKEPIEWRVLDIDSDGHLLVISNKVIELQDYNTTNIDMTDLTWETSTLRSWLNGYGSSYNLVGNDYTSNNFIDTAFTAEEKARIIASKVLPHPTPNFSTKPGNETTDKIFLLSHVEANQYFTDNEDRKAYITLYALNKGAIAYNYSRDEVCKKNYFYANNCTSPWWLRSPGQTQDRAASVGEDGALCTTCPFHVNYNGQIGLRPAMWLK